MADQENLPIVHLLCNPGLRGRHWEQMNEIAGFNITPDSGTSLRKMLKHNLESHFDEFEGTQPTAVLSLYHSVNIHSAHANHHPTHHPHTTPPHTTPHTHTPPHTHTHHPHTHTVGISGSASKEFSLEKAMQRMEDDWDPITFNTTLYRDTGETTPLRVM